MKIHKTAIVSKKADIGKGVEIGPWCVIEGGVVIGDNCKLWQNVYAAGGAIIGKDNTIHMGVVVGHEPQHLAYDVGARHAAPLQIGDGNTIREYVTIHRAFSDNGSTIIGNKNYFMACAHIAHDCKIGNEVIMCNAALLGGHVEVEDRVFIGGGAAAHQFARIGTMAMIGGLTRVVQDVLPYTLVECDAEVCGLNLVGIRRSNLSGQARKQIKEIYNIVYCSGLSATSAVTEIKKIPSLTEEAKHIAEFIEKSKRGLCKPRRELKK